MAWQQRIWNVFRGKRLNRNLERELAFHLRERIDELQEAGHNEEDARRMARLAFGNFTTQVERTRDMDISAWLDWSIRNLKYAVRSLSKTPAFTITAILTLALGIGANSAVFSAIYAVLLRPLPFPNGDQVMKLGQINPKVPVSFVAPARLEDWNRMNSTFQAISGYYSEDTSETSGELPEKLKRTWGSPRFLQVLGVAPSLGRDFSAEEEKYGGPAAVLISDRLWRRRFGADPNVIGRTLRAPTSAFTIIGVMPPSFQFPGADVDLWGVSPPDFPFAKSRELTWFSVIGRLKPGVTVGEARANLAIVQRDLGRQFPKTDANLTVAIDPLKETTVGHIRRSLWVLFGSVSLLLLIACTNIAALLLSRATSRQHEISVRFSLGASRASVAGQLLVEVLMLAVVGAMAGLFLAAGTARVFQTLAASIPRVQEIELNGSVVAYSLVCAVAVTLLCGIIPVIRGTRRTLSSGLSQGSRTQVAGRNPVQFTLVGVQVALAVTLLAGAGLLLRSFQEFGRISPGFDPVNVLTFHISSSWAEAGGAPAAERTKRILEGLRTIPGVEGATLTSSLPGVPNSFELELKTPEGRAETEPPILAQARWVTPEYFNVLRIPLVSGEMCRDDSKTRPMMVNRALANLYFHGEDGIGKHLALPGNTFVAPGEIRGVVSDARETGLDREPPPTAYWCNGTIQPLYYFLVRTHVEPIGMGNTIRRKIHEFEPLRSVYELTPLESHISGAYAEGRLRMILLASFAFTAIALASVGLYGTLSYLVSVRQREVALRIALGALRGQIVRQFLSHGLGVSMLGCLAGLGMALASTRLLSGMLYGISATDPMTFGTVTAVVLIVACGASLLPAIRAARLEPMANLRQD